MTNPESRFLEHFHGRTADATVRIEYNTFDSCRQFTFSIRSFRGHLLEEQWTHCANLQSRADNESDILAAFAKVTRLLDERLAATTAAEGASVP